MRYRLFDLPGLPADEPDDEPVTYSVRVRHRNERTIELGWHPATHQRLMTGVSPASKLQCKDCCYAFKLNKPSNDHWKCHKNIRGVTRGERTNVRLKWPACVLFERKETPCNNDAT